MSKCISREGEYSDHTSGDERFYCGRCYVFDESAAVSALEEAEAERDAALARIEALEGMVEPVAAEFHGQYERAEKAEARIAEAAKLHRRDSPGLGGEWCQSDGLKWPCPTAVSLGLTAEQEGENGD